ncbi:hypothetical protein BDV93DRAFT_564238 [Ceratobasidium sp. AG-I]|nr:hypothetical protein BDV93DRAFT_564238 [Ceratobasidium sp. AG-I]
MVATPQLTYVDLTAYWAPMGRQYSMYPDRTGADGGAARGHQETGAPAPGVTSTPPIPTGVRPLRLSSSGSNTVVPPAAPAAPQGQEPVILRIPLPAVPARTSPVGHPGAPHAAGYPIGAQPTDSISLLVIWELDKHQGNNADPRKNSATGAMKLGLPPDYNGGTKAIDFKAWVAAMLGHFCITGILGPMHNLRGSTSSDSHARALPVVTHRTLFFLFVCLSLV